VATIYTGGLSSLRLSLGAEFIRIVNDEFVVPADVDERVLGEVWSLSASEVDVDQVGFSPEGSKSEGLHLLPPSEESRESRVIPGDFFTLTRMQLDLQLSNRQGLSSKVVPGPCGSKVHRGLGGRCGAGLGLVKVEESLQRSKLCAFDVDFEDVDEVMTVVFHEPAETPHLDVHVGAMVVDRAKRPGLEMGSVSVGFEFRTPTTDAKIVSPDLASRSFFQEFRFKGRFPIYPERVNNTFLLV